MTTEEKAKAYDELKVKAQQLEEDGCFDKLTLFDLFPELRESEDEKIRKGIIEYLRQRLDRSPSIPAAIGSWIAWLEKQGEKGVKGNKKEIPFSEQRRRYKYINIENAGDNSTLNNTAEKYHDQGYDLDREKSSDRLLVFVKREEVESKEDKE